MSHGSSPDLRQDSGLFARWGALAAFTIATPAMLFAQDPNPGTTKLDVHTDFASQKVVVSFPTNSGFTSIQGQISSGNLSSNRWFTIPGGLVSANQSSVEIPMHLLPAQGCFFRGATNELSSDIQIGKERISGGYNITVRADDRMLRNPDGSVNAATLGKYTIQNSWDGVHWSDSGYDMVPKGIVDFSFIIPDFAQTVPALNGSAPFVMSRIVPKE